MATTSHSDDVLTAREVAEMLRLETKHPEKGVERLRRLGRLRGKRVGRRYLYTRADVMRFLQER